MKPPIPVDGSLSVLLDLPLDQFGAYCLELTLQRLALSYRSFEVLVRDAKTGIQALKLPQPLGRQVWVVHRSEKVDPVQLMLKGPIRVRSGHIIIQLGLSFESLDLRRAAILKIRRFALAPVGSLELLFDLIQVHEFPRSIGGGWGASTPQAEGR